MDNKSLLYLIISISSLVVVRSTNQCIIQNAVTNCIYDVICDRYAGGANNPSCSYEPYVTFIITNSNIENLGAGFFGSTNFDSRVREIKAFNNTWTTIIETTFRYYSKTIKMNLSNNKIKNIQEGAFGRLFALESLNISRNIITRLEPNSLSTLDNKDTDIRELDLSFNNIEYLPSDLFKYMGNIETLYLQYNKINVLNDDVLTYLKKLSELMLQHNNLSALNMALINLKSLKYLDVSFNNLSKLSGYELNRITSLVTANFSYNAIETIETNCFNQAFNLQSVDLRNNKIMSAIEVVLFINNGNLRYLNLEENCITQIQDNAFKLNSIEYINLEKNNITGAITNKTFLGINATSLNLYNQSVTIINEGAFIEMKFLKVLNISKNTINTIESNAFGTSENLYILDLSRNNISELNFLKGSLTNLSELYLSNNFLTEINSYDFVNQTQLKKLDISMNKIKIINKYFLPLNNVQYINITGNYLTGGINSDTFSPAKYIRYLDFSNCNISKVESLAFVNLSVIARMNLSNNIIYDIHPNNFMGLNNMYSLDISNNRLKNLQINYSLQGLRALYLNNNNFSNIPTINVSGLVYLDISDNNIKYLSGGMFEELPHLKVLHISNNKLKIFNNPYTNSLKELTDLGLSHNGISSINLSYFNELISLDLSSNKIDYINSTLLQGLDYLQSLDISHNNITKLAPGTFQFVKILKFLNISSNHVSNIRYGTFKGLHRTEVLDLSKNEITDIDVDIFHECLELKKLIVDYNKIKVLDVEKLLIVAPKLSSLSLGGNPVACKEIVRNIRFINRTLAFHAVEVTSIHKIYHEDNVYGIKCGDIDMNVTKVENKKIDTRSTEANTTLLIVMVCCLVLILIFILAGLAYYYYKPNYFDNMYTTESRLQMRHSLELNGSEFNNDLLS